MIAAAHYALDDLNDPESMDVAQLRAEIVAWRAHIADHIRGQLAELRASQKGAGSAWSRLATTQLTNALAGIASGEDLETCALCGDVKAVGQPMLREVEEGEVHAWCLGDLVGGEEPGKPGDRYQLDPEGVVDDNDEPDPHSDGILVSFAYRPPITTEAVALLLKEAFDACAAEPAQ
jgi:hypothetical protein